MKQKRGSLHDGNQNLADENRFFNRFKNTLDTSVSFTVFEFLSAVCSPMVHGLSILQYRLHFVQLQCGVSNTTWAVQGHCKELSWPCPIYTADFQRNTNSCFLQKFSHTQTGKNTLNKLIKKSGSVVGSELDMGQQAVEHTMLTKLGSLLNNTLHLRLALEMFKNSTFSCRLIAAKFMTEFKD